MDHSYDRIDRPSCELPSLTSLSLLERARVRDPEAWRRLVKLYTPLIYRWCRRSRIQASDAADVVQDVFQAVLGKVRDFRRDRPGDSFRGWLCTITKNKIRDQLRRGVSRPQAVGGTDAHEQFHQLPDVMSDDDSLEEGGLAHRALELIRVEFEDRTWQAFWRSAVEGHLAADVACDLAMTTGAVRQAKYRVLQRLRAELDDLEDLR